MEAGIQILHRCGGEGVVHWVLRIFFAFYFSPQLYFFFPGPGDPYLSVLIFVFFFWGMGQEDVGPYGVLVFLLCQMPEFGGGFFFIKKNFLRTERRGRLKPFFRISVLLGPGVGGICILIHSVHVQAAYVLWRKRTTSRAGILFLRIGLIEPLSVTGILLVALYDSECGCYLRSSVITRRRVLIQACDVYCYALLPLEDTHFGQLFSPHKTTTGAWAPGYPLL